MHTHTSKFAVSSPAPALLHKAATQLPLRTAQAASSVCKGFKNLLSDAVICASQVLLQSRPGTDLHCILFQTLPQSIMSSLPTLLICIDQLVRISWSEQLEGGHRASPLSAGSPAAALQSCGADMGMSKAM